MRERKKENRRNQQSRRSHLVKPTLLDRIHDLLKIEATPGGREDRPAPLVPAVHHLGIQPPRFHRVESAVAGRHAEDLAHPIEVPEPHHQLPDHGVEPRAEPATGDDRRSDGGRVEVDGPAGPRPVVSKEAATTGGGGGGEVE